MAGLTAQFRTFNRWNLGDSIGCKLDKDESDRDIVVEVWCKLCAKHLDRIRADSTIKGRAKSEVENYATGTNYVSKYTIMRHLASNSHAIAANYEKLINKPTLSTTVNTEAGPKAQPELSQPRIDNALTKLSKDAYRKLINTAYMLAVDGMPLTSFKTLVKIQKCNGVNLITGLDSSNKAREFVHEIADAIRAKLALILCSVNAFSLLSDGSQARKTGHEKELVLIRVVRGGIPVYYCVALQDVDSYGDANAENLKTCIDDVFGHDKKIQISKEKYTTLLVSATSDGASVNTGIYNGLLTRLEKDHRPWLLKIHCVSHRAELALKDALMNHKGFAEVKDFMIGLYYLFKQSGKIKRHFNKMAELLNVQVYVFPKVHGTRFLAHQHRGLKHLLHNWVILALVLENSIELPETKGIKPKLQGILTKLKNYTFFRLCCAYKQILDNVSKFSLTLEKGELNTSEVMPAMEKTKTMNTEMLTEQNPCGVFPVLDDKSDDNEPVQLPFMASTRNRGHTEANNPAKLTCQMPMKGHKSRKTQNQEYVSVSCGGITHTRRADAITDQLKTQAILDINQCLTNRFSSFTNDIYKHMKWIDPAHWYDTKAEVESLTFLANHFSVTLEEGGFEISKLKNEWKDIKHLVHHFYSGIEAKALWNKIFQYKRKQFPNICLLAEIVLCLGVSNSVVEGAFSQLTALLSDRRLCMKEDTLDDLLLIKFNNLSFTETERESIIDSALTKYMSTRRKLQLESSLQVDVVNVLELDDSKKRKYEPSDTDSDEAESDGELGCALIDTDSKSNEENESTYEENFVMTESESESDHDDSDFEIETVTNKLSNPLPDSVITLSESDMSESDNEIEMPTLTPETDIVSISI